MDAQIRDFMLLNILCATGSKQDRQIFGGFKYLDVVELKRQRLIDLVYPSWHAHDGQPILRITTLGWEYCQQHPALSFWAEVSPYADGKITPVPVVRHSTNRI
jgi:hypothetical protein